MPDEIVSPEFEAEVQAAETVPPASPVFVNTLRAQLSTSAAEKSRKHARSFFLRPAWLLSIGILALVLLFALLIGPQKVLAAVHDLFGYIPGIGFVQNGAGLRVLSEPVTVARQAITLSVEQGAADDQHTVLVYHVEGLSLQAANSQGEAAPTGGITVLAMPDGTILTQSGGESTGWGTGFQTRLVFPPLPPGANQATLLFSRLQGMPSGAAPENWLIPIRFKPAPPDLKMMPVYVLATAQPQPAASAAPASAAPASAAPQVQPSLAPTPALTAAASPAGSSNLSEQHGIRFSLDRVAELENGYLFQGRVTWNLASGITLIEANPYQMQMLAAGQTVPVETADTGQSGNPTDPSTAAWAVRSNRKDISGLWQLTAPNLTIYQGVNVPVQVDFGRNLPLGVKQPINQSWVVAGHTLHATAFTVNKGTSANLNVTFEVEGGADVLSFNLYEPSNMPAPTNGGGGGGGGADPGKLTSEYAVGQKPEGLRSLVVSAISYQLLGPWQVSWQPPLSSVTTSAAPPPQNQPCLTTEKWQQIKANPAAALPAELSGRMLLEEATGELMPQMTVFDLAGSQSKGIGLGGWSTLSPDGATVAFIKSDGPSLYLANIASGVAKVLPGSLSNDYHPVWSPDGQWIAFVRGNNGIYIIHPDGTGLAALGKQPSLLSSPAGWLPDSRRLVLTTLGAGGSTLQILDTANNTAQKQFVIDNPKGGFVQLSPDGQRLSFSENAFGYPSYGLYISNLDGSAKRLVAALTSGDVSATTWSPDGKWLALDVLEFDGKNQNETPLLLQPDTCEILPLPGLRGRIASWKNTSP